jgi:hypothetical protein
VSYYIIVLLLVVGLYIVSCSFLLWDLNWRCAGDIRVDSIYYVSSILCCISSWGAYYMVLSLMYHGDTNDRVLYGSKARECM